MTPQEAIAELQKDFAKFKEQRAAAEKEVDPYFPSYMLEREERRIGEVVDTLTAFVEAWT